MPKYDLALSPVSQYMKNSPTNQKGSRFNFNVDTASQQHFLAQAAAKAKLGVLAHLGEDTKMEDEENLQEMLDYTETDKKENVINKIPIV